MTLSVFLFILVWHYVHERILDIKEWLRKCSCHFFDFFSSIPFTHRENKDSGESELLQHCHISSLTHT